MVLISLSWVSPIVPLSRVTMVPKRCWRTRRLAASPGGWPGCGRRRWETPRWRWPRTTNRVSSPHLLLDRVGDRHADPAEPGVAERVGRVVEGERAAVGESAPSATITIPYFLPRGAPARQHAEEVGQVDGDLGDQDIVGPDGHAREAGDPAGLAAHRLDHDDPAVALGRRAEAVDRLGHDVDRRVEAEGEVGHPQVVVDRLGDADDRRLEIVAEAAGRRPACRRRR